MNYEIVRPPARVARRAERVQTYEVEEADGLDDFGTPTRHAEPATRYNPYKARPRRVGAPRVEVRGGSWGAAAQPAASSATSGRLRPVYTVDAVANEPVQRHTGEPDQYVTERDYYAPSWMKKQVQRHAQMRENPFVDFFVLVAGRLKLPMDAVFSEADIDASIQNQMSYASRYQGDVLGRQRVQQSRDEAAARIPTTQTTEQNPPEARTTTQTLPAANRPGNSPEDTGITEPQSSRPDFRNSTDAILWLFENKQLTSAALQAVSQLFPSDMPNRFDWMAQIDNIGSVYLSPAMYAATKTAYAMLRDVFHGRTLPSEMYLITQRETSAEQRVRVQFAELVAACYNQATAQTGSSIMLESTSRRAVLQPSVSAEFFTRVSFRCVGGRMQYSVHGPSEQSAKPRYKHRSLPSAYPSQLLYI